MVTNIIHLQHNTIKREIKRTCTAPLFASAASATRRNPANIGEQNLLAAETNDAGMMPTGKKYG